MLIRAGQAMRLIGAVVVNIDYILMIYTKQ